MPLRVIALGTGLLMLVIIAEPVVADSRPLVNRYLEFSAVTKPIVKGLALRVQSREQDRRLRVHVYGFVDYPFSQVADILASSAATCDFLILNMNVKACTFAQREGRENLVIYVAGKKYAPLFLAMEIEPWFELQERGDDYLRVLLTSPKRRWAMPEYTVVVEASPYKNGTLVHFSSIYEANRLNKVMTGAYLKTFGWKKVGFTETGRNSRGQPEYVRGMQGIVERNAVRSYLALQAYLDTADVLSTERFESRLRRWFELTDVYSRQLHEMDWQPYLNSKQREYQNQLRLQQRLSTQSSKSRPPPGESTGG